MQVNRIIEDNVDAIDTMAKECNIAPTQVREVVSEVIPTLISGIRETAKNESEIETFFHEFEHDHFDLLLTEPEHLVERENIVRGNEVLDYVLKSKEVTYLVSELIEKKSGVEASTIRKIVPMLATILMGVLEKTKLETTQKGLPFKAFEKVLDQNTNGAIWKEVRKKGAKWLK